MKLLLCPKGYIGVKSKDVNVHIDVRGNEQRGYALVRDDVAEDLLKREGYEIVDPKSYSRDINLLYAHVKKTLRRESLQALLNGLSEPVSNISSDTTNTTRIPTPVFIPSVWTTANDSNWPVTMTYTDAGSNPVSFVFTHDFTLSRPCAWCRFKYWLRSKFRTNKSK